MATTYDYIGSVTTTSTVSSIDIDNIPNTYRDLIIVGEIYSGGNADCYLRLNDDSGNNYSYSSNIGTSGQQGNSNHLRVSPIKAKDTEPNVFKASILEANQTTKWKNLLSFFGSTASFQGTGMVHSYWKNTASITKVTLLSSTTIASGSTFAIYGIA